MRFWISFSFFLIIMYYYLKYFRRGNVYNQVRADVLKSNNTIARAIRNFRWINVGNESTAT